MIASPLSFDESVTTLFEEMKSHEERHHQEQDPKAGPSRVLLDRAQSVAGVVAEQRVTHSPDECARGVRHEETAIAKATHARETGHYRAQERGESSHEDVDRSATTQPLRSEERRVGKESRS